MYYPSLMAVVNSSQELKYILSYSLGLLECVKQVVHTSRPLGRCSNSSNSVFSTNSNTRYNFPFLKRLLGACHYYLLNASLSRTIFSCLSSLSIFTSRIVVFLTTSSSSELSLNFFTATMITRSQNLMPNHRRGGVGGKLTVVATLFIFGFVDNTVGSFTDDANYFVFIHIWKGFL